MKHSNFKSRFLILLLGFLTIGIRQAWGADPTITLSESALELTGSYTTNTTKAISGVTFCWTDLMKSNSTIQAKASSGVIYNTTALPGNIISVAVTHSGTARSTTISFGTTSACGSEETTWSGTKTISPTGDYKYFKITRGSNAAYWTSIVITYEDAAADPVTSLYLSEAGVQSDNLKGTYNVGDKYTLPETCSQTCGTKTFVGWSTKEITTPITEPKPDFYEPGEEVTLAANNTFYAVFADGNEGDASTTFTFNGEILGTGGYKDTDFEWEGIDFKRSQMYYNNNGAQIAKTNNGFWNSEAFPGAIKQIKVTATQNDATLYVGASAKATTSNKSISKGEERTIDFSTGNNYRYLYIQSGSSYTVITTLKVTYVGTTYSNYTTTCATKYSISADATNGSILWSLDGEDFSSTIEDQIAGTPIFFKLQPNTGYKANGEPSSDDVDITDIDEGIYGFDMPEKNISVSATFAPATYQISYDLDGGEWTGAEGVATYTYGTGVPTLPTNVEKANNTFEGWYSEEKSAIITSIGTTETGDKSLTAIWTPSGAKTVTINGDSKLTYTSLKPTVVDKDAENLEIEYSIEKGYTIVTVTVKVGETELTETEVEFSDSKLTITPADGFTDDVAIQFMVANKMFTVTWMANKTQFKQEEIQEGNKVTLPATNPVDVEVSAEEIYKFQGWIAAEQYSSETIAPDYIANNTIEPTGDVTYYAVYAILTPGTISNDYTKITATTDLVEDGQYIIASGTKALNSDVYKEHYMTATDVTISNNKITNTNTKLVWTIEYIDGGDVLFKSNGNGNYLQIIQDNTYYNLIAKNNDATNASKSYFTPSVSNGNWTLEAYSVDGYYVGYKSGSGYTEFTAVNSSSNLQLYKRQNNPDTYKNYRTRVAVIDHIAVHEAPLSPERTNLVAGETFDATGLSIDVYYVDEVEPTNVTEGFTYAPTTALATTDNKVTFTYQGKTADVNISVSNTVSGIEVTNNPSTMEYTEGQQFNPEGMEVTATYNNGAERVVTGYDYEPKGDLALGDKITISFGGKTTELVGVTINEAQKTTVNWFVEDVKLTEGEQSTAVIPGKKITVLPTEPEACQGNQFVGWTAVDANYYNATTAPIDLFKTLAEVPTIGETETNFYAVFAQVTSSPIAESTVYTSNISEITGKTVKIAYSEYDALQFGTGKTPQEAHNITVPAGTTTLTLHAASWNNSSDVTLTASTEVVGVSITPSTAVSVVANTGLASNSPWTITPDNENEFFTFTLSGVKEATSIKFENNNAERVVIWGVNASTTITSDYSTTCIPPLVAPTLTKGGEFCTSVNVTISKGENPGGVTLKYSTDGGTSWTAYSEALPITTTTTIKAKAVMGLKESKPAEATYTILTHYNDLTALKAVATDDVQKACVSFSNLLVNATNVNTVYLTDGTNSYMISKSGHGFSRGQKLSTGEHAILPYKLYNGVLQFNDNTGITAAEGTFETPATTMAVNAITANNYGQLVKIENVIYVADGAYFEDGSDNKIKLGNNIVNASSWVKDGAIYDITGIITTQMIEEVPTLTISPRVKDLDVVSKAEKLDPPSNLTVSDITGSSAKLSWTKSSEEEGAVAKYNIVIMKGDEVVKDFNTTDGTKTSYGPTGLVSGTTYTWKIRAIGNDLTTSTSDWTDGTATFTTLQAAKLVWMVNGEQWGEPTYAVNEKVVMPEGTPTSECSDNYQDFICWVLEPIEGVRTEKIYDNMRVSEKTAAKSKTDGSLATYTFYAAFGKVETEGSETYVKVTANQDDWTGDYLIGKETSGTIFDGSRPRTDEELDDTYNTQSITIPEDGIITNVDDVKAYQFSIAKSSTTKDDDGADAVYYTIKSAQNYYIGGKDASNGMNSNSSFATKTYDNIITWLTENNRVQISSYYGTTYLTFNNTDGQQRFRYMKNEDKTITLYKRVTTPTTYSAYITTCPTFYDITIADGIVGGSVDADPKNTIDAGATIQLTADASAGYTAEGGVWTVTNVTTTEAITVNKSNQFTMPASDVTVSYAFVALEDKFNDALHGAAEQKGVGAQYELPTLANTTEGTRKDAFFKFAGWVPAATEITTGEPATEKPTILEGKQDATGATYKALWANAAETAFITEECGTAIPTNLHVVNDALTANSAKLDWNNVTNATKYHVSVYQATTLIVEADVESSEYVVTGLTAATEYNFTVKAFKGCWGYEATSDPFTTKAEIASHLVTLVAENGQIEIDPELTDGKLNEGTVATVTATANKGYYFVDWNFTNVTPTSVNENVATFAMPTKAITITANFAEYPKVTWKMAGQADVVISSVLDGDKFVIGADNMQAAPENWKYKTYFPEFAGWVTADKCDAEGNVTTAEFITATTEVPATGLTVYGAVAKSASADCSQATKITSNENLDMSALYVIGVEYNETTIFYNGIDGTWGKTTYEAADKTPIIFTISGTKDALALLGNDGNYIKGCTSKSFAVSTDKQEVMIAEGGNIIFGTTTWYLQYNNNNNSGGLRWYSSTSNPLAYLYQVPLVYENLTIDPQPDYGRTDLVVGNYGTVCVPYAVKVADRSGATFWNIETSNAIGSTNPTSVTIVQEEGDLVAGKPYIFCATDTKMALFFSGGIYDGVAYGTDYPHYNGLYGNLTDAVYTINATEYVPGYFFVLQQKLYECGVNCTVSPNRGWVQADQIGSEPVEAPISAPRRVIGNPNGTPTGINNLNTDGFKNIQGARKYFHNNHIVIVNEGRIFNAQGILIQ